MKKIKLLICDVDGTMTDGGIGYIAKHTDHGVEMSYSKTFNARDGRGFHLLWEAGVDILMLTGFIDDATMDRQRFFNEECGMEIKLMQSSNKKADMLSYISDREITINEVAYIGDDTNDLEAMCTVADNSGLIMFPADAHGYIKNIFSADLKDGGRSIYNGGSGAVREICDFIIMSNKAFKAKADGCVGCAAYLPGIPECSDCNNYDSFKAE